MVQVTRSIGDDDLKPAVTAEPEITETILSTEDEFLVRFSSDFASVVALGFPCFSRIRIVYVIGLI